jgi:hypothetical protein
VLLCKLRQILLAISEQNNRKEWNKLVEKSKKHTPGCSAAEEEEEEEEEEKERAKSAT